jgi:tetratricopeptide (TPR) repeat protein
MLGRLFVVAVLPLAVACEKPAVQAVHEPAVRSLAPLLEGLGRHGYPVSTRVPLAQRYFDQGLVLAWAFDFAEAERAFREALRLDPQCAMCAWGVAYARGPNINRPDRSQLAGAIAYAERAVALAHAAPPSEQALIRALAVRYGVDAGKVPAPGVKDAPPVQRCITRPPTADTDPLDYAYAQAMNEVEQRFPQDLDIALLHAEALLLLAPWDWWSRSGEPRAGTLEAIAILERILAAYPDHPGANHYLVHALENSPTPERALAAARRLGELAPAAGHLVHMPSHIYVRVGRYADASRANEAAIEADRTLARQVRAQGFEVLTHVSHHHHFLWATTTLEGRGRDALAAARTLAEEAARDGEPFGADGTNDYFLALPLAAQVRFARFDEVLAAARPGGTTAYPRAVWHWARGIAHARAGRARAADEELARLQEAAADASLDGRTVKGIDALRELLAVAQAQLAGEIALAQRRPADALGHFRRALAHEQVLEAEEPPLWALPARLALASALLVAGRAQEAEREFRAHLSAFPDNGWALYGLAESLRRQGRGAEATRVATQFRAAWASADLARPDPRY